MKSKFMLVATILLLFLMMLCPLAFCGTIERISVAFDGGESNYGGNNARMSADGRFVVFQSEATNLVPDENIIATDIFVRDRFNGTTTRLSVSNTGVESNKGSQGPSISADGRYIAFECGGTNIVPGDTNGHAEIFVYDQLTGEISRDSGDIQYNDWTHSPRLSPDGRYLTFDTWASNVIPRDRDDGTFIHDRLTGEVTRSLWSDPKFSTDNRYFISSDSDAVIPIDTNGFTDVFVYDRMTPYPYVRTLVSVSINGIPGNGSSGGVISADGSYAAFYSAASDLVPDDTNNFNDIFVRNLIPPCVTTRVSVSSTGEQANEHSGSVSTNADGKYVAFSSKATNLVPDDTNKVRDIFLHNRITGETERISVTNDGTESNGENSGPTSISKYGRYVLFTSLANLDNISTADAEGDIDIFVYDQGIDVVPEEGAIDIGSSPSSVSLSPNSAAYAVGKTMALKTTYSDPDGYEDIATCHSIVNPTLSEIKSIWLKYDQVNNKLYIRNDAGTTWVGGITPGTAATIQNSQCSVYCGATTVERLGNDLTINWNITFKIAMAGKTCNAWLKVIDSKYLMSNWKSMGASLTITQKSK
ncbi:MAG: TolB family protein [Armatimonadota bacterium]